MSLSLLDKALLLLCYYVPRTEEDLRERNWGVNVENLKREGYVLEGLDGVLEATDKATPLCEAIRELPEPKSRWTMS